MEINGYSDRQLYVMNNMTKNNTMFDCNHNEESQSPLALVCRSRLGPNRSFDEVVLQRFVNRKPLGGVVKSAATTINIRRNANHEPQRLAHQQETNQEQDESLGGVGGGVVVRRRTSSIRGGVQGRRLSDRLFCLQSPSMAQRRQWAHALASGLATLHAAGLAHGNLTADHVVFESDQVDALVITGMVVPSPAAASDDDDETVSAPTTATRLDPAYSAPEVLSSSSSPDYECSCAGDVFALGRIIWQLVTLQRLPANGSPPLLAAVANADLRRLLHRCSSVDPAERPPVQEIAQAFVDDESLM